MHARQEVGGTSIFLPKLALRHTFASSVGRFQVPAARPGGAFVACTRKDRDLIFSLQFDRTMNRDKTVSFQNTSLQIEPVRWRGTVAGCSATLPQHFSG